MIRRIRSAAVVGVEGRPIEIEVDVSRRGLPAVVVVGLPDTVVREARDRVKSAILNSGYRFPNAKVIISLAPAGLRKEGATYDLPIALGILAAGGGTGFPAEALGRYCILGELALDGRVRAVRGALPMAIALARRRGGPRKILLPAGNAGEARAVEGISLVPVRSLHEAVEILAGARPEPRVAPGDRRDEASDADGSAPDLADVRGQVHAKRALLVAAAGGHNILLLGPPGTGKTMLARRLPGLLPPLRPEESLHTSQIHSAAGLLAAGADLIRRPPFRAPHHTVSQTALIGGGHVPRPGEVSLAHNGVLFLDEMAEFPRRTLEILRQPLEEGVVEIVRSAGRLRLPARVLLAGATNPCPCGFHGHPVRMCRCSPRQIERYVGRLSGPLLDRIDLHVEVPAIPYADLAGGKGGEGSARQRRRVVAARERQLARGSSLNGHLPPHAVERHARLRGEAASLLGEATDRLSLSGRAYHRILRVARTMADLDGSDAVRPEDVAEALQYRGLDGLAG